jgi:outer membrane protein OmpA-like peptidoglycan-associated protein
MQFTSSTSRALAVGVTAAAALLATGCADMQMPNMSPTARNTAVGAGIGGVAGAAIGRDAKGAAIGAGLGALGGYVWSQHMEQKKQAMQRATAGTGVAVTQTPDNQLKLNIPSDISFDTGRADIKSNLRPILDQFASGLSGQPNTEVRIVGHTDNTGSDSINDPLSQRRADAARDYLAARGVDPRRILTAGRGEHEPIAENTTDAGRAKNRRVEIFLGERSDVATNSAPGIPATPVR